MTLVDVRYPVEDERLELLEVCCYYITFRCYITFLIATTNTFNNNLILVLEINDKQPEHPGPPHNLIYLIYLIVWLSTPIEREPIPKRQLIRLVVNDAIHVHIACAIQLLN